MHTQKISLFMTIVLVLSLLVDVTAYTTLTSVSAAENSPSASNSMSVVVQFSTVDRLIRKVSFSTSTITGLDALLASGLDVVTHTSSWGTVVCAIEGVGCPADDCFCAGNNFWNYEYWDGTGWQSHSQGAGSANRGDGAVDGWRWGEWGGPAIVPYPQLERAWDALQWLKDQQNTDGGYGSPSSAASSSVESLLAIGANHYKAAQWKKDNNSVSLLGYLMANGSSFANSGAGAAGKFAVGASAAELCLPFLAKTPPDFYDSTTGQYHSGAGPHAWAMLGTAAISETIATDAVNYLKSLALPTGGWEWSSGWGADTNTTALAIQALIAAGVSPSDADIVSGLNFIKTAQNDDGGFTYDPNSSWGTDSDTNSTAYVLQAIYAVGGDPTSAAWQQSGKTAFDFLATVQQSNGSFEWQPTFGSNLLATQQVIPALLGRPAPYTQLVVEACKTYFMPLVSR